MDYYLGIDGGGTKTKIVIIDNNENILFENVSGPSSIDTVDQETSLNNIKDALAPFTKEYPKIVFKSVFAGLGGIVFPEDEESVESFISKLPHVDKHTFIKAKNDMHNAMYSSGQFDQAMTLICGTGMVAFGKKGSKEHKAGGWGFYEGELGSSYHLGREAIRHCIRAFDHRVKKTDFALDIAKVIGLNQASDIIQVSNQYHDQRTKTAALAPIVTKYANLDNQYAKDICDHAISELALAIHAVYQTLEFNEVTLVIVGSLGNAPGYFHSSLTKHIKFISQSINVTQPIIDPALGAAKAAKYLSEVSHDF